MSKTYCNNYPILIITIATWILFKGSKMYNIHIQLDITFNPFRLAKSFLKPFYEIGIKERLTREV